MSDFCTAHINSVSLSFRAFWNVVILHSGGKKKIVRYYKDEQKLLVLLAIRFYNALSPFLNLKAHSLLNMFKPDMWHTLAECHRSSRRASENHEASNQFRPDTSCDIIGAARLHPHSSHHFVWELGASLTNLTSLHLSHVTHPHSCTK
jgi:hypothetical protein